MSASTQIDNSWFNFFLKCRFFIDSNITLEKTIVLFHLSLGLYEKKSYEAKEQQLVGSSFMRDLTFSSQT